MKLNIILRICLVLVLIVFFIYSFLKAPKPENGFASHYTASRILLEEKNVSKTYDTTYFNSKIREYGIANIHDIVNFPTGSFYFVPLALLDPVTAKIVWTILLDIFYIASILILLNVFNIDYKNIPGLLLICLLFLFHPAYLNIALGQDYILILFFFSLSIYGLKKSNIWLASLPLTLVILLNGYGFIPLFFLIVFKKWKEAAIVIASVLAVVLLALPLINIETWAVYYQKVFLDVGYGATSSGVEYQTINSFIRHIFIYDAVYNPNALFGIDPNIVKAVLYGIDLIILLSVISKKLKSDFISMYVIAIGLNVLFAPIAEEYHYVMFVPLIICLVKHLFDNNFTKLKIQYLVFIASSVMLAVPVGFKSMQNSKFPLFLFAYPKLCAGIALLVLGAMQLKKKYVISEIAHSQSSS